MSLNEIAAECHENSQIHGFWDHRFIEVTSLKADLDGGVDNPSIWAEKIALMHSEASEMLEALRDDDEPKLAEECADLLIRLFDFTDARKIDMDEAVAAKMNKNQDRPWKHGRKF